MRSSEAIYYFSSILSFIGMCIMVYVSTWPNAKIIGKKSLYKGDSKSIELQELNTEKKSEVAVVVPQTEENTAAAPQTVKEPANVPQTEENTPQLASSQEGQPTTTISVSVEVHNTENQ